MDLTEAQERDARGETGFYVVPKFDCSHTHSIKPELTVPPLWKCEGTDCGHEEENWLCLTCSKIFCSRYVKGHMAEHKNQSGHPIALSFSDLTVWCYDCDSYIRDPCVNNILQQVHTMKFEFCLVADNTQPNQEPNKE
eukprot:TRINITY_DN6355_c0_g1_i1.p1 TRINITY_DN6355_c0_g1~~TRINITY_DN6355_c0_g1_i1.p1  ORF type:complete len:152 (-),score=39.60 TRINITY_DN6355_c0_g1_i1:155-568(-)